MRSHTLAGSTAESSLGRAPAAAAHAVVASEASAMAGATQVFPALMFAIAQTAGGPASNIGRCRWHFAVEFAGATRRGASDT